MAAGTTGTLLAGRYRVLRRLGSGGMASVFLAEDERLGRKVAVKRLHSESADEMARRFVREAKVGASLNHPSIVSVYDTVTDDEGVLLVMEYVDGETLRDAIARGPLPAEQAMRVLRAIASALDHAHEHGVVHRDVKPGNILIGRDGQAKLADLGIASAAELGSRITQTGTVLGTAAYIAPERLDGGLGGPPSDVYALAAVAHEALSGHKAVEGSTPVEVARRVMSGPAPDLARHWPDAPPQAVAALQRGMARDPRDRPGSPGQLVAELGEALEPTRATTPLRFASQQQPRARRLSPAALAAVAAMAAVAIAVVLFLTAGGGDESPAPAAKPKPRAAPHKTNPTPLASDPAKVVSDFYKSSVGGNIDHAWSISTDRLHVQVGGRESLQSQESTLTSIDFTQLTTVSKTPTAATVSFADDAHHQGFTDHCTGTANLVPGGPKGWLLDHISVQCGRAAAAAPPPATPPGQGKKDQGKAPKQKHGKGGDNGGD